MTDIMFYLPCRQGGVDVPKSAIVTPVQAGTACARRRLEGMAYDDEGDGGLSRRADWYGDLTVQHWAWRHSHADVVGFLAPDASLDLSSARTGASSAEPASGGLDEASVRQALESVELVVAQARPLPGDVSVEERYRTTPHRHGEDLDCMLDLVVRRHPALADDARGYLAQTKIYPQAPFAMRRALFDEYASFLFDVLGWQERLSDASHYTVEARHVGTCIGELLFGIFVTHAMRVGRSARELRIVFRPAQASPRAAALPEAHPAEDGVSFGPVTRGGGKIYIPLSPVGAAARDEDVRWRATSELEDGTEVPAKVVQTDEGPVLVLAVLAADQTAHVSLQAPDGSQLIGGSKKFSATLTKLSSKANTLLHDSRALSVRNCDTRPLLGDVRVTVDRVVCDVDGTDVVLGTIVLPPSDPASEKAFFEVVAVGAGGHLIELDDWACMGDRLQEMEGYPGARVRTVTYSLRLARPASFCVWVRFPGHELQDGFACIEWFVANDLRDRWRHDSLAACSDPGYDEWFRSVHRASSEELALQRRHAFARRTRFSIVVPLFHTPLPLLREMAGSVLAQTYPDWELVLVNASPDTPGLADEVRRLCEADARIIHVDLKENLGITENTNAGIAAATGDFLCFLDHDDLLEPDALYWYADAIERDGETDMLYCDEDKLLDDEFRNPFFKPDWNVDLLCSMNYVCHLLAVRASIVAAMDPPTREYDGSQDHHMALRVGERARRVVHIPRVLYHWRMCEGSTALVEGQKDDYALDAGVRAVQSHLDRCGIPGQAALSPRVAGRYVVRYAIKDDPLVSIIIPNKDALTYLARCLASISLLTTYDNYEVVIVENNSEHEETFSFYQDLERTDPRVRVVRLEGMSSFNFSRIINCGAAHAQGDYLLMLNNDTKVVTPAWIEGLLGPCQRADVGATGAKLLYPDGLIQHAGVVRGLLGPFHWHMGAPSGYAGNNHIPLMTRDVMAVTGACLLTSRETFERVGRMDETLAVNYNDVDYCYRVLDAGLKIVMCPDVELLHYESVSRGFAASGPKLWDFRREMGMLMERWPAFYDREDPYRNKHVIQDVYDRIDYDARRPGQI